jgi:hypothetical protein
MEQRAVLRPTLHELDRYMARYTGLSLREKRQRRKQGLANFLYVRYGDDFVVLCNGTKAQAEAMRQELHQYPEGRPQAGVVVGENESHPRR